MFEVCEEHTNLLPSSFSKAISLAEDLIKSSKYEETILFLLPHIESKILKKELNKTIRIAIIESKDYLGCYGIVSRIPLIENKIFLNPLMLNQMRLREIRAKANNINNDDVAIIEKNALFLCIKIVHEFSHLLNYSLSLNKIDSITPAKNLSEINPNLVKEAEENLKILGNNKKLTTIDQQTKIECFSLISAVVDDFGEMMEICLFGGVIEHKEPIDQAAFAIEDIIIYDFSGASKGYIAKWRNDIFVNVSENSILIKDSLYKYKSYMTERKQFLPKNRSSSCSSEFEEDGDTKTTRSTAIRS